MKYSRFHATFLASLVIFLASCTQVVSDWVIGGGGTTGNPGLDIIVISKNTAIADGFSELTLNLKIQDRLGNPQPNIAVAFDRDVVSGINFLECSLSDQNGFAICTIKAHRDGIKELKISGKNQTVQVEFTRQFDKQAQLFDSVGASHSTLMAGPDLIKGSAGKRIDKPLIEESGFTLRSEVSVTH